MPDEYGRLTRGEQIADAKHMLIGVGSAYRIGQATDYGLGIAVRRAAGCGIAPATVVNLTGVSERKVNELWPTPIRRTNT